MQKLWEYIRLEAFVAATGLAALWHSTWTLGTLFAGDIPDAAHAPLRSIAWHVPAFLLAFAIDVGQLSTAHRIRSGERNRATLVTFAVLALSTYYLQWLYMAAHIPAVELGAGVRAAWEGHVEFIRDAALWIVPALLPLSTLLYTASHTQAEAQGNAPTHVKVYTEYDDVHVSAPTLDKPAQKRLRSSASGNGDASFASVGICVVDVDEGYAVEYVDSGERVYDKTYTTERGATMAGVAFCKKAQRE